MPRRAVRRRRRAGLGAVHGQGRVQGADGPRRRPAGRLSRGPRPRSSRPSASGVLRRPARARAAGVRQAGAARILGRDRPCGHRGGARRRRSSAFEHDPLAIVEAAASGLEVECSVLGNSEPIASEPGEIVLAAGESGWYDYEAKYTPGRDAADRARAGLRPRPRARPGARGQRVPAVRLLRAGARGLLRRRRARCS